jgi:hypothetical protein
MMLEELRRMVGREHRIDEVNAAVRTYVRELAPAVVGAYHISCSDESEKENRISFYDVVVRELLPDLKFYRRSAFKTTNLGGRYERGAIAIAEDHFATPASKNKFKVLVVKLSSHVSVDGGESTRIYGRMDRYDRESIFCGALHALLDGVDLPAIDELRATFSSTGVDRVALLNDPEVTPPRLRPLAAAIANVRLQTDAVLADIASHRLTLNRLAADTELFCGFAIADTREPSSDPVYLGLGDHPARYSFHEESRLAVTEPD